jgi:hypothetical protein
MRKKAIIFVGRLDVSDWDNWVKFCQENDLDVYVISYTFSKDEAKEYINLLKLKFTHFLRKYHIERTVVDRLEYNTWSVHPRSIQFWRLWDFYTKTPQLAVYDILIKARLDLILPLNWKLPEIIPLQTIFIPRYIDHPYGLIWSDQLAIGHRETMKKYCLIWSMLPTEPPIDDNQIFFAQYSPESLVATMLERENVTVEECFHSWELKRI